MVEDGTLAADVAAQVVSRVKVLARMDIAERRLPQDGQLTVETAPGRANSPPRVELPVRLRREDRAPPPPRPGAHRLRTARAPPPRPARAYARSCGDLRASSSPAALRIREDVDALFVHAAPRHAAGERDDARGPRRGRYRRDHPGADPHARRFTFATGLRAILRQDPDVILVGEIRDSETASIALQAALTGHLVLTTLHTSSTVETIVRLVDLGVDLHPVDLTGELVAGGAVVRGRG